MIIDECQYLEQEAKDVIRNLYEDTEVGICLVGNKDLVAQKANRGAISNTPLPASLREMLDIIPQEAVFALVERYGGTDLYVSKASCEAESLAQLMGPDVTKKFIDYYQGQCFFIPRLQYLEVWRSHQEILKERANGGASPSGQRDGSARVRRRCCGNREFRRKLLRFRWLRLAA